MMIIAGKVTCASFSTIWNNPPPPHIFLF
jgi:hypothetical protein